MPREGVEAKGRRLLAEGRLVLDLVDREVDVVRATCRGSGALHRLGYELRRGGWYCDCAARSRCSHLVALELVTVVRKENP